MSERPLSDKVIVIIGGTTGLGISAATACVHAGAAVVVVGRDAEHTEAAVAELGSQAHGFVGDAIDPQTSLHAIRLATEKFGPLAGLYHVAGGSGRRFGDGPLDQITDEGWHYTLDLNLTSLFNSNRAATQQFLRQRSAGSVLNMGSVLAHSPAPHFFATHTYATTKAAVIGLTQAAAAYYAPQNIRFNVIAPAVTETPLAQRAVNDAAIMRYLATKQPIDGGRVGQPADVDAAVVYFLSDASRFVTGQVLAIDGGWSVSEGQYAT